MKHAWQNDICGRCGLRRGGYSGGRTGRTYYYRGDGEHQSRAGDCPGKPSLVNLPRGSGYVQPTITAVFGDEPTERNN